VSYALRNIGEGGRAIMEMLLVSALVIASLTVYGFTFPREL
jgi:hypothetical protein